MPNVKKKGYSARDLREVSDNPELTKNDFGKAKPFAEVFGGACGFDPERTRPE